MLRTPRTLILVLATALLTFGGCGVDDGDRASDAAATTSTTRAAPADGPSDRPSVEDDPTPSDLDIADDVQRAMADAYIELGFTEDEATCLAAQIAGAAGLDPTDPSQMMDLINECDISMSRLTEVTQGIGGGDIEETMRNSMAAGLRASGLPDEQADCIADAVVDEFGADASKANDPAVVESMFERCGVDPDRLGN